MDAVPPEEIERWFTAIGQVVVAAANLEGAVGTLLYALETGSTDQFYARTLDYLRKQSLRFVAVMEQSELKERLTVVLDVVHQPWMTSFRRCPSW